MKFYHRHSNKETASPQSLSFLLPLVANRTLLSGRSRSQTRREPPGNHRTFPGRSAFWRDRIKTDRPMFHVREGSLGLFSIHLTIWPVPRVSCQRLQPTYFHRTCSRIPYILGCLPVEIKCRAPVISPSPSTPQVPTTQDTKSIKRNSPAHASEEPDRTSSLGDKHPLTT